MPGWIKDKVTVIWKRHSVWMSSVIGLLLFFVTCALAIFTALLFDVSQKSIKQQGDYYKATTRPFVNLSTEDSLNIVPVSFDPSLEITYTDTAKTTTFEGTLSQKGALIVRCSYKMENFGFLPAIEVQSSLKSLPYPCPDLRRIYLPDYGSITLYPKSKNPTKPREMPVFWNDEKHTFLHCAISYKDITGKEYYSLSIIKIKIDDKGKIIDSIYFKSYSD